jgi:hypothetical protein
MHIALLAPTERSFISQLLPDQDVNELPMGYYGAPFIGTLIAELLHQIHQVAMNGFITSHLLASLSLPCSHAQFVSDLVNFGVVPVSESK